MTQEKEKESNIKLSSDRQINALLNDMVGRLKEYTEDQVQHINKLAKIGVALSSTRNLDVLLEMILDEARAFTRCDAGTLYLINEEEQTAKHTIIQTESTGTRMGGASGNPINWPPVSLIVDGKPNNSNVCAYVANSGKMVNIPDVYEVDGFDFQGPRKFDKDTGYRTKSMMVFPMLNHEGTIIGVMQLINALDSVTGETIPFAPEFEELSEALASQAAVAITNAQLIHDLENLFESFIQTIATAIDEKSPYTGGHIERVANLTMEIAHRINDATTGKYADTHFSDDELTELRLAAWLHDTGKITTPEYVVDKQTKLETIFDRMELVRMRFQLAIANEQTKIADAKAQLSKECQSDSETEKTLKEAETQTRELLEDYEFVEGCNETQEFVRDETIDRLRKISEMTVETSVGKENLLLFDELHNLEIRKGNLTKDERKKIENHVVVTRKMLEKVPFPKKIRNVPFLAGAHHEKLSGKGYPDGLKGDEIPLQARILTLADVFEALTAADRPYKPSKKMSAVLKIIGFMIKDSELDPDLAQFFLDEKMHIEYARKHMKPSLLDVE
ncbi:MAG: HD domain-containing phosphohydrolase [Candidatus Hatepunaea meridiana]|nr:HD domain-containing phosphohydrolase [Candidatus Hatepunaea meridiana]